MWYRSGTVAVQSGSVTVTGTGTSWAAPAVKEGYAFIGPDGRLYEIEAINSGTALTLASAYEGSDETAAAYVVAPTQSLNVELHAAMRALLDLATGRLTAVETTVEARQAVLDNLTAAVTAASILSSLKTVDGAGSDLDADLLDGQHGSFYRNAGNLNAGTVPSARLSGTYSITATYAQNSDKLDGQHGSFYRNAGNISSGTLSRYRLPNYLNGFGVAGDIDLNNNDLMDVKNVHFDTSGSGDFITWETAVGLKGYENGNHVWTIPGSGSGALVVTSNSSSYKGSLVLGRNISGTSYGYYADVAGSHIQPASASGATTGSPLAGRWRCLGRFGPSNVTVLVRFD